MAHQASTYSGFCSIKRLGVLGLPDNIKFSSTYSRSSCKRPPREFEKVVVTRAGLVRRSRKRPHGKTIEDGRSRELQKLINNSQRQNKRNNCLMSVFISDIETAELNVQFFRST